jgi:hypothetical protein
MRNAPRAGKRWGNAVIPRLLRGTPIVLVLFLPPELTAQVHPDSGRIVGRLLDGLTLTPVVAAEVRLTTNLIDTPVRNITDEEGRFLFISVRPGSCRLEIEHLGYGIQSATVDVPRGGTLDVEVHLAPEPVRLEPLEVVVHRRSRWLERQGFYRRKELGFGHVFGRAELDDWRGSLSLNLQRVPGVYRYPGDSAVIRMLFPGHYGLGMCAPTVFVNGWPDPLVISYLDVYHASELEGVEVYRAPWEVPGKYRVLLYPSRLTCGVILLWVRGRH